tara:strand:- start:527 stop:667 length:141 start_codon:yes stop_codon:yes gene_type:complete
MWCGSTPAIELRKEKCQWNVWVMNTLSGGQLALVLEDPPGPETSGF